MVCVALARLLLYSCIILVMEYGIYLSFFVYVLVVFCKVIVRGHLCYMCFVSYLSCYSRVPKGYILGPRFGFNYCCKGEAFRRDAFGSLFLVRLP